MHTHQHKVTFIFKKYDLALKTWEWCLLLLGWVFPITTLRSPAVNTPTSQLDLDSLSLRHFPDDFRLC